MAKAFDTARVTQAIRTHGRLILCAALAAVFLGLWLRTEAQLASARREVSAQSQRLLEYASLDDRMDALKRGAQLIDYQRWAEEQPRFVERQGGVTCIVEQIGKANYRVSKFAAGVRSAVTAEFSIGGPKACDRIPL